MQPLPYPTLASLRRAMPWQSRPRSTGTRRAIAVHEAAHVVLMQWIGLQSPSASIVVDAAGGRGEACFPGREFFARLPDPPQDESGVLSATGAAIYHAGVVAEMLDAGIRAPGPIFYPQATDYLRADDLLLDRFGRHSSAAHFYAQQVARHVLSGRWREVEAIAQRLTVSGTWAP